jgi:glycosyltransferase involved in cell wall biosynthesis
MSAIGGRRRHHAGNIARVPRRLAGRLWYMVSPKLDAKPEELLADALGHAALLGRAPVCLAASFPLSDTDIERFARKTAVGGIVTKHRPDALAALRRRVPGANLGGYWEPGVWSLPAGALHVYFVGSWRHLTMAMLREAVRRQVLTLTVRCARMWVDVPLDAVRRLALARAAAVTSARRWSPGFGRSGAARPSQTADVRPGAASAPPLGVGLVRAMIAAAAAERLRDFVPGRVVLVCGNLQPGGAERQVAYTARGLARVPGIDSVQLVCDMLTPGHPARYDFYLPLLRQAGIAARTVERAAVDRSMVQEPAALVQCGASLPEGFLVDVANLYRELVALRPEVVHAWLDWSNTRAGLAAALAGVPRIVLSGRNLNPTNFALYQPYMDPVYQALCLLPNVVFLNNSRAGAESYRQWLNLAPDRIKVVYNGLDMGRVDDNAAAALRKRLGIPPGAPLVGGVFRLFPEKRPLLWVEVAARVFRANPDTWFVLFGRGDLEREIVEAAAKSGIGDRLVMPGITEDVGPVMRSLDVFLLTSFGEGVPNVVLEAQWAGTPVVATKAGGVAEAIAPGRTGWIVDPPEAEQLARRVCWLLADRKARAEARIAGPEFINQRFGLQRMIEETVAAYGMAVDRPVRSAEAMANDRNR